MKILRLVLATVLVVGVGSAVASWLAPLRPAVPVPALQIEVLNGCGESGLGQRVADRLRDMGHDVVRVDDAPGSGFARTVILDRRGRDRLSRGLARQIGPCPVLLERTQGAPVDLTLIVGADYPRLRLFSESGPV